MSAKEFHQALQVIYHDLKLALAEEFEMNKRTTQELQFQKRVTAINQLLPGDTAKKLKNIKLRTQEYCKELFTCLHYQIALPENNLAERSLRHLVLKRKRSFGSNTANGVSIFATNFSVVYSLWKKFPQTFFPALSKALAN